MSDPKKSPHRPAVPPKVQATIDYPKPPAAKQAETLDSPPSTPEPANSQAATLDAPPAPPPAAPSLAGRRFGDYEILEELARGGMGVVFKARQNHPRRIVALKMILAGQLASPQQVRRFLIEAEEAGQLDHPNIVPIYQVGEHNSIHFFSMKLIEGTSLAETMPSLARQQPRRAALLVSRIARAVHYAHQRGVLHRDLKPGNILLDGAGEPHVTDFGLAKHLGGEGANTQSGAIVGTPSYMAPEQAQGRKDLSVSIDVYGLGAILFELVTGQPPFLRDTPMETIRAVLEEEPPAPRSLNGKLHRDLETICLKCLAKDPGRRYASAKDLADDLDSYLNHEPIQARPAGRVERLRKWIKRRPALATLVGAAAVGLAALLIVGSLYTVRLQAALAEADQQRQRAESNEKAARRNAEEAARQRDEVKASFAKRLDLVPDMVQKIDGRLKHMDGMQSVRVEILHEVLDLSQELLKERPDDLGALRQTAKIFAALGELRTANGQLPEGAASYQEALKLMSRVASESGKHEDRSAVAQVHFQRGELLRQRQKFTDAIKSYQQAIALQDQLVKDFPELAKTGLPQLQAARALFQIGNCQEDLKQGRAAEQAYRDALQRQETLASQFPNGSNVRRDLARTAFSLGSLPDRTDLAQARRFLERSNQAWGEAYRLAPQSSDHASGYLTSFFDLLGFFKARAMHAEMLALGRAQSVAGRDEADDNYNAACIVAEAVAAVPRVLVLSPEEHRRLGESYGREAVGFLRKAIQSGFRDRNLLDSDPDLHPLRQRRDFLAVLEEFDKRQPSRPRTPAQELVRLVSEHAASINNYQSELAQAQSVAERRRAQAKKPDLEPTARRVLELARKHADVEAAVDALVWVLRQTAPDARGQQPAALKKIREEAVREIEQRHFNRSNLVEVCQLLAEKPSPAGDQLLQKLAEQHPQTDIKGLASYARALSLQEQWDQARQGHPKQAEQLSRQVEEQYQRVIKDFGTVPFGQTTLGNTARASLHRFLNLAVGRPALEIEGEDVAGQKFKLSDHRGKVVVLSFWAHWCGYCRQLYPHEKELVQRYQGQPFALLGVNCEDNRAEVAQVQKRVGMTWRSWWSQAGKNEPIANQWQVDSFPTIYVLDAKGVIRYRFIGVPGPELDQGIEQLLQEARADGTARAG